MNFRGVMVPKGTPNAVIDKLAASVPEMFENGRVAGKDESGRLTHARHDTATKC